MRGRGGEKGVRGWGIRELRGMEGGGLLAVTKTCGQLSGHLSPC